MLRYRINEFEVVVDIILDGPLLIAAGEEPPPEHAFSASASFAEGVEEAVRFLRDRPAAGKEEEGGVDNEFVQTERNGEEQAFLPGSSLKGVLRQRAEQLARTMGQGCCDPFAQIGDGSDEKEVSCSARIEQQRRTLAEQERRLAGHEVYRMACPVCKVFGCLGLASRLAIGDAYVTGNSSRLGTRDGVGIDRRRGGAREKVKFKNEVMESGRFRSHLRVRNFELWQLGLLAHVLDSLVRGAIRVGHGTHRGLGQVFAEIQSIKLSTFGDHALSAQPDRAVIAGLGTLAAGAGVPDVEAYGFTADEVLSIDGVQGERDGLRYWWVFPPPQQEILWSAVAARWRDYPGAKSGDGERGEG